MADALIVERGVVVTIAAGNYGEYGPFMGTTGGSGRNVLAVAASTPDNIPWLGFEITFDQDGVKNSTTAHTGPRLDPFLRRSLIDGSSTWETRAPLLPADTPSGERHYSYHGELLRGLCQRAEPHGVRTAGLSLTYVSREPDNPHLIDWTLQRASIETDYGRRP